MAARLQREPTPAVLSNDTLFTGRYEADASDLHPDGDRLVIPQDVLPGTIQEDAAPQPERFLVVTNWFEELREAVGN